ncbi:MAG: ammonium transporter [Actinomycetota bacterium]|nr:ammonium transporter [Actinomycetota bacterium]MDH4352371.1 ammonium transporter [Actinomycetota bacterium]
MPEVSGADTAWVLVSAGLVLLMTPALALFYGGMVRAKSVINMMMMSFAALGVVSVTWVLFGYSMAFGDDLAFGLVGNPFEFAGLTGLMSPDAVVSTLPSLAFVGFQGVFAVITVALVSGAIADRARFGAWVVFAGVWATVVYFPVAHWVFAFDGLTAPVGGWIANQLGAVDFAGGTAVHINAGAAGLALALVLGRRIDFLAHPHRPHNLPLVMIGAGLLWFGWFGFNAGSALGVGTTAAVAWVNTLVAPAASALSWLAVERVRDGHVTSLGAASGAVAGLVAITPACAAVSPLGAVVVGVAAGVVCALAIGLKERFGYDDSLDVVGVHLVGGLVGCLMIGFVATDLAPSGVNGLFFGGGLGLLGKQAVASLSVLAYSFVVTYVLAKLIDTTIGFRIAPEHEEQGIDHHSHKEMAYDLTALVSLVQPVGEVSRRKASMASVTDG